MKKFLLSAFALAVAFSAAAFNLVPNNHVVTPRTFNGKIEKPTNLTKPSIKFMKADSKISSLDDISGEYVMLYYSYFDDFAARTSNVTITKVSGDTYTISGWWQTYQTLNLTATVDQSAGTLTIARQQISAGSYPSDLIKLNMEGSSLDEIITSDPIVCNIYSDGIIFDGYWAVYITSGSQSGKFQAIGAMGYVLEPNGTMTWGTNTANVYLEQSNDTIFAYNYGGDLNGYGYLATIKQGENHTFAVPTQRTDSINETYGVFYFVGMEIDPDTTIIETGVTGTGTKTVLTANNYWSWYSDTGYWNGVQDPWVITRTDGNNFVWPGDVETPDVYILGEVGDQTWAPNAGVQMAYGEETGLYTAEIECKDADNNGYDYFSFTTQLAENADDWDAIAAARFGAVSEGDFLVTDELLGQELSLEASGDAYKVLKGKYNLTLDYANMKLVIEKVAEPFLQGDVNGDGDVNVMDITALIDIIMNDITDNPRADVNGDTHIDVMDITALIDIIMNS